MANQRTVSHDMFLPTVKLSARQPASPRNVGQKRMTYASDAAATYMFAGTGRRGPAGPRHEDGGGVSCLQDMDPSVLTLPAKKSGQRHQSVPESC